MDLIVLGSDDSSSNFYAIPCAKALPSVQNHLSSAPQCLLHLNDRLLVYTEGHRQDVSSTINPDTFVWNNVMVPAVYLSDNWPIRVRRSSHISSHIFVQKNFIAPSLGK